MIDRDFFTAPSGEAFSELSKRVRVLELKVAAMEGDSNKTPWQHEVEARIAAMENRGLPEHVTVEHDQTVFGDRAPENPKPEANPGTALETPEAGEVDREPRPGEVDRNALERHNEALTAELEEARGLLEEARKYFNKTHKLGKGIDAYLTRTKPEEVEPTVEVGQHEPVDLRWLEDEPAPKEPGGLVEAMKCVLASVPYGDRLEGEWAGLGSDFDWTPEARAAIAAVADFMAEDGCHGAAERLYAQLGDSK